MVRDGARLEGGGVGCSSNPDADCPTDLERQPKLAGNRRIGAKRDEGRGPRRRI